MAKKILLAEDSVTMQKVFQMTFAAEDFTVSCVSSGVEAIDRAKAMRPDVVIADLSIDGKNGYDVCAALKSDASLAKIPVLLLHSSSNWDEGRAKAVHADGEIVKPFETQAVIDKVKGIAVAPAAAREPMGPITSLAPLIESAGEDVVIDTDGAFGEVSPPAAPKPAPPAPKPAVAKPAPAPKPAPKPAVPPPPAPKPAVPAAPKPAAPAKPAAPPPRPAVAEQEIDELWQKPAPPAPKPATPPSKPASALTPKPGPLPVDPKPAPASKPAPAPKAPPAPARVSARPAPEEVEITIEAEPPPGHGVEPLPSFESPVEIEIEPSGGLRPHATMLGLGLPPPPPGMSLPAPPVQPAAVPPPPLRPGAPYEAVAYEAIAKLTREVIEKIVWEVVPDLAERIIREELDRLVENRRTR
jgi:CheY-like chemotaxis protein